VAESNEKSNRGTKNTNTQGEILRSDCHKYKQNEDNGLDIFKFD